MSFLTPIRKRSNLSGPVHLPSSGANPLEPTPYINVTHIIMSVEQTRKFSIAEASWLYVNGGALTFAIGVDFISLGMTGVEFSLCHTGWFIKPGFKFREFTIRTGPTGVSGGLNIEILTGDSPMADIVSVT